MSFTLTTSGAGPINLPRAGQALLRSGLATSAAWPSETQIRVPPKLRQLAKQLARLRDMQRRVEALDGAKTWRNALRLGLRHPEVLRSSLKSTWASKVLPGVRAFAAAADGGSARAAGAAFLHLAIHHPFTAFFLVLPNVRISRRSKPDAHSHDEQALGRTLIDPDPEPPLVAPDEVEDDDTDRDPVELAEEAILDQQVVAAAERKIDSSLFTGRDRDEDRFVRLQLQNTVHRFTIPGAPDRLETVVFEPRLLLHESGVAQLTVRISTDQSLTTDQAIAMMWGQEPRFTRSELPDLLIKAVRLKDAVDEWVPSQSGELTIGAFDHASPSSIYDELSIQMDAVGRTIGTSLLGHWSLYPTAFVQAGRCCSPKKWQRNHAIDIERIRLRFRHNADDVRLDARQDFSMTSDHSLFVTLGSATYFEWQHEPPEGISELFTTLIIEYGLLLFERLCALERTVSSFSLNETALTARYRDAVALFAEMRQGDIRAGQARDIADHLLTDLGGEKVRRTIETALDLSGAAYATKSANIAARRSFWLTVVGTAIAALVAIPPLEQVIDAFATPADLKSIPEAIRAAAGSFQTLGADGPALLVVVTIVVIALGRIATAITRFRPRGRPRTARGYAWPTPITVRISTSDDD